MSSTTKPDQSPAIKPLSWILGKWRSVSARVIYPTMKPFDYEEEIEFFHFGLPMIQFNFNSWNPENKSPMAKQTGFIRFQPDSNKVAFMFAMNLGLSTVEEGTIDGQRVEIETVMIARMSFGKEPKTTKLCRTFQLKDGELEQIVNMATTTTPLQEHLRVKYRKIE